MPRLSSSVKGSAPEQPTLQSALAKTPPLTAKPAMLTWLLPGDRSPSSSEKSRRALRPARVDVSTDTCRAAASRTGQATDANNIESAQSPNATDLIDPAHMPGLTASDQRRSSAANEQRHIAIP